LEKIVTYSNFFNNYLTDLIDVLFFEDYFSYVENAENYAIKLRFEIDNYIDFKQHHFSPKKLKIYGEYYITVSLNKRTTWFVFFDKKDNRFLVQFITNNHTEDSEILNL
jgi:hypothetical protein